MCELFYWDYSNCAPFCKILVEKAHLDCVFQRVFVFYRVIFTSQ